MKKSTFLFSIVLLIAFTFTSCAQNNIPDKELQIATAVLAAPEQDRAGVTVYGYDKDTALVELRKGTNSLICIANDPRRESFQAVCYHQDLQPFMERGRALKAEGKKFQEIFDMREAEAKSGQLKMPENPSTMHLLEGKDAVYDAESGSMKNARYRYVVLYSLGYGSIHWATT